MYYRYIRLRGVPFITIAYDWSTSKLLNFGVAICSPRDMPNKKKGKELAEKYLHISKENKCCISKHVKNLNKFILMGGYRIEYEELENYYDFIQKLLNQSSQYA